jgi:predicted naringenin-chalcone synthase
LSKIISIGTAVPQYCHKQEEILRFMQTVYCINEAEKRKLKFLYHQSSIEARYSVIPDYSLPAAEWTFYPPTENLEPFPSVEKRMHWFNHTAPKLSQTALENCITEVVEKDQITHLITVTCTGLSAPGLDLQLLESMALRSNIFRTSVNFMGCYAAIHALKLADSICKSDKNAVVAIVCTELCTLHFQNKNTPDNIASSLLFGDGSAAVLVTHDEHPTQGMNIKNFYSEVALKGKRDMSWGVSSNGFQMTLSGYIPDLIQADFEKLLSNSLHHAGVDKEQIQNWCVHPGGRKILESVQSAIGITEKDLEASYKILKKYGNMSSPTILFVLKEIINKKVDTAGYTFAAAFGPGLSLETVILQ